MKSRIRAPLASALVVALVALVLGAPPASAGAIITYGNTSLGVNDEGHLNFSGLGPGGSMTYGVFRAGVGDAISPGCFCEGWGVSVTRPDGVDVSGWVNRSSGDGGLTGGTFGATASTATSNISLSGYPIEVEHRYGPSLAADVFQAQVRITNNGASDVNDLTYRRVMDWDVPPTEFNEFVTHQGVAANLVSAGGNVQFASDNGFATSNPLVGAGFLNGATVNTDFVDNGPDDHGSVFDFAFGSLAAGETRLFNIFYGSRESEASALGALAALGVDVYSLGQNSITGTTDGTPATFLFAFGGVGGVEPGSDPENPILPFVPAPGQYEFPAPIPRRWYDPPMADGFEYELFGGALFTQVGTPPPSFGFGPVNLMIGGSLIAVLNAGDLFDLTPFATSIFRLVGINPDVDAADPTAFPTFLDWSGVATSLTMTALPAVPEPTVTMLVGLGLVALGRRRLFARAA